MRFQNGIHQDQHESRQPEGTYRDALNLLLDDERGALRNEAGTSLLANLSTNYSIVGSVMLSDGRTAILSRYVAPYTYVLTFTYTGPGVPDDIITVDFGAFGTQASLGSANIADSIDEWIADSTENLAAFSTPVYAERISTNQMVLTCDAALTITDASVGFTFTVSAATQTTSSQIGIFNGTSYTLVLSDSSWDSTNKLEFGPTCEMTSRINHSDQHLIYWTDDVNPPRYLNLTTDTGLERSTDSFTIFPTLEEHPYFQFEGLVAGGSLTSGAYHVALAYVNSDGTSTAWFYVSHPISVNDDTNTTNPDAYDGAVAGYPTNRAIKFSLANIDTNYTYLRVALISGSDVKVMPQRVISLDDDSLMTIVISGNEAYTDGTLEEIAVPTAYYTKAKTLRQVDDRLYLGNLETLDSEFDYQKYANNIVLSAVDSTFDVIDGLGYKDNEFSFNAKGFRRDEVYAFYLSWVLKDGSETKAFHIPGRATSEDTSGLSAGYIRFDSDAPSSIKASQANIKIYSPPATYVPAVATITVTGATSLGVDVADATFDIPIPAGFSPADIVQEIVNSYFDSTGLSFPTNISITVDPDDSENMLFTNRTGNNEDWNGVEVGILMTPKNAMVADGYAGGQFFAGGEDDEGVPIATATIDVYGETINHIVSGQETAEDLATACSVALNLNGTLTADYNIAVDGVDATKVNIVAKVVGTPPDQFNSTIVLDYSGIDPLTVNAFGVGGGNEFYAANENELLTDLALVPANEPYIGRIVDAFNIPGGSYDSAKLFHFSGAADSATGMGYWENTNEVYPDTNDWDIWDVTAGDGNDTGRSLRGEKVRHHRFPDNYSNSVFLGTDTANTAAHLGIRLTNIKIPDDMVNQVIGFKVYYAERTDNNKTILDQAEFLYAGVDISTPGSETYLSQNKASDPAGSNSYSQTVGAAHPFNLLRRYPDINLGLVDFVKSQANIDDTLSSNRVGLASYVPEAVPRVRGVAAKTWIQEGTVQTDLSGAGFTYPYYGNDPGVSKILLELDSPLHGAGESTVLTVSGTVGEITIRIEGVDYTELFDTDADTTAINWVATHAATLLALVPSIVATITGTAEITLTCTSDILWQDATAGGDMAVVGTTGYGSQSNHLINICSFKLDVYNSFTEQGLVWTGYFQKTVDAENDPFNSTPTSWHIANASAPIYGGDTFISQYTIKEHTDEGASTYSTYSHDVVCESDDNLGFRHEGDNEWEIYYPKSSRALFEDPGAYPDGGDTYDIDNPINYNEQYSSLQNFKVAFPYDGSEPDPTSYPTRVVRSVASDGTTNDHFRRFLVADYLDFPRQRGELIHMANMGSIIIAHMNRGLYRTRGKEELNFSDIRAFIGSGDIFSVQPTELGSSEIGLGGLQDQRAAVVTSRGYFWVDRLAKRIYQVAGEGMRDVTGGLTYWMENNLDNMGILHLVEDMAEERLLITGYDGTTEQTLSMDLETNTWTSFHSYRPQWYFATPNKLYSVEDSEIHQHHVGDYGDFYGTEYDSYIEFIENDPPGKQKQIAYMLIESVVDDDGVEDITSTFDSYRITNSYQDTGTVPIDTTVSFSSSQGNARHHRGFWRLNVGRDTLNIPSTAELRRYGTTQAYQKRLIDKWHNVRLTKDNAANNLLYIFHAQLITRQSKR